MQNKLLKTGIIGTIVAAVCCFTPFLVWVFSVIGLTSLVIYLDIVLLPLLGLFVVLLIAGLIVTIKSRHKNSEQDR
jgi:mercuric ion transport protein